MSQEGQLIYKTTNDGATWKEVGSGPSTWLLQSRFVYQDVDG